VTGPQPFPGAAAPPIDSDDDDIGVVDDLPDDVPNDDLTLNEPPVAAGVVADTDVDAPVVGSPPTDDEIEAEATAQG
jgi:hypothetical protein